jgi:hypothetical protein
MNTIVRDHDYDHARIVETSGCGEEQRFAAARRQNDHERRVEIVHDPVQRHFLLDRSIRQNGVLRLA